MAKRKRRKTGRVTVEVMWMAKETMQTSNVFTADKVTDEREPEGGAVVRLVNGRDANGPVLRASYRRVERILVRPAEGKDHE